MARRFDYECGACEAIVERLVDDDRAQACEACGAEMRRLPPLVSSWVAPWLREENIEANARLREFNQSDPETVRKLKTGQLDVA